MAPARVSSSPRTGTSRRLDPRYLITRVRFPTSGGQLVEHHAGQQVEMTAGDQHHRVTPLFVRRGQADLARHERALEATGRTRWCRRRAASCVWALGRQLAADRVRRHPVDADQAGVAAAHGGPGGRDGPVAGADRAVGDPRTRRAAGSPGPGRTPRPWRRNPVRRVIPVTLGLASSARAGGSGRAAPAPPRRPSLPAATSQKEMSR